MVRLGHAQIMTDIITEWGRAATARTKPGGDLHRRPWTREQMIAPLAWHEAQMAVTNRFGVLSDGSTGWAKTRDGGATWTERPDGQ